MPRFRRPLNLQAKVFFVLMAVIVPTFLVVTLAENKVTKPILEDDMRLVAVNSAKNLATEIATGRLLFLANAGGAIESRIQEILYAQPNITRMDVITRDPLTNEPRIIASNIIEEDPVSSNQAGLPLVDSPTSFYKVDEAGIPYWEVAVPIEQKSRDPRGPRRLLGSVRVEISLKVVEGVLAALWRTTVTAAIFSVVTLIIALSYFLRKTLENERKLRQAETQNLQLTEQLHEVQRELMTTEKLAVMGQLTASFAHEIGTPLNAVGGHLQLLGEEVGDGYSERLNIIQGQLTKIEGIVKGFLQSTAKPPSQHQLVDVNPLVERTLQIVLPRIDRMGVAVRRDLNRAMGPVRMVPLDLEQIFLNLLNNSLDSLRAKASSPKQPASDEPMIEIASRVLKDEGREWAEVSVYDTGEGIRKGDLANVLKPFFTTKRPGEGTGLGLTICRELVHKYGGQLSLDSKEGLWTRVTIRIPYV